MGLSGAVIILLSFLLSGGLGREDPAISVLLR